MKKEQRAYIPRYTRHLVKSRFNGRCGYCGQKPTRLCIDHIEPHSYRQNNSIENLMPACFQCNNYKTVFSLEQFRRDIQDSIVKARKYSVNFRFAEKYELIEIKDKPVVFYFETITGS